MFRYNFSNPPSFQRRFNSEGVNPAELPGDLYIFEVKRSFLLLTTLTVMFSLSSEFVCITVLLAVLGTHCQFGVERSPRDPKKSVQSNRRKKLEDLESRLSRLEIRYDINFKSWFRIYSLR